MHRKTTITLAAAAALAAAPVANAKRGDDHHASTKLSRGTTTLAPDPAAAQGLAAQGIAVTPLKPARATSDGFAFPITNGRVDTTKLTGTIKHVGGLRFSKGDAKLDARNFRINLSSDASTLTANVNDRRIVVANLDTSGAQVTQGTASKSKSKSHSKRAHAAKATRTTVTISGIKATLSKDAADGLNATFATTAFAEGQPLGTLTVASRAVGRHHKAAADHGKKHEAGDDHGKRHEAGDDNGGARKGHGRHGDDD